MYAKDVHWGRGVIILGALNIGFWHKTTHRLHLNPQNYLLQTDHLYKSITLVLKTPITDTFSRGSELARKPTVVQPPMLTDVARILPCSRALVSKQMMNCDRDFRYRHLPFLLSFSLSRLLSYWSSRPRPVLLSRTLSLPTSLPWDRSLLRLWSRSLSCDFLGGLRLLLWLRRHFVA